MSTPSIESLSRRLTSLEKQNSWLKATTTSLAVAMGGCLLLAAQAPPAKIIEAEKFALRDKDGIVRAVIEMKDKVGPRIAFFSKDGLDLVGLGLGNDGNPALVLVDAKRQKSLTLAAVNDEQALVFRHLNTNRLVLATDKHGDPVVVFRDGQQKVRTILSGYGGDPGLHVRDANEKTRITLAIEKGEARLQLLDADGKAFFTQPSP